MGTFYYVQFLCVIWVILLQMKVVKMGIENIRMLKLNVSLTRLKIL